MVRSLVGMSNPEAALYLTPQSDPDFNLLSISMNDRELVHIKGDGSVITLAEGCEQEAAKVFYQALQFEGMTLFERVKKLEGIIRKNTGWDV